MTSQPRKIDEALAFFQLFDRESWKSCYVRTPSMEVFISKEPGHANPMTALHRNEGALAEADSSQTLKAPHIGTLIELAPVGALIAVGESYGALSLLDERIEVIADRDGVVAAHLQPLAVLVEYDQPLMLVR